VPSVSVSFVTSIPGAEPTDTVQRPDPGLARGLWEAPTWIFYAIATTAVVGALIWMVVVAIRWKKAVR
jgi:hypothetical protein